VGRVALRVQPILRGDSSRDKLVEVDGIDDDELRRALRP
jgi:hypothetical protein